ncbi:MAG: glucokinase [Polyangiaceae bacterium]|nr:glucokinase [Polyangiaceae bacterium]
MRKASRTTGRARVNAVLAGDVGGTRARFALVEVKSKKILHEAVLSSREHSSFDSALRRFLSEAPHGPRIRAASFGIAGPIVHQRVRTTNLPWRIDARAVARDLNLPNVTLSWGPIRHGFAVAAFPLSRARQGRSGPSCARTGKARGCCIVARLTLIHTFHTLRSP